MPPGSLLQIEAPPTGMVSVPSSSITDPAHCGTIWDGIGYAVSSALTVLCPYVFQ